MYGARHPTAPPFPAVARIRSAAGKGGWYRAQYCLLLLFLGCVLGCSSAGRLDEPACGPFAQTRYFEFHSSYLVNLHHCLFDKGVQWSRGQDEPARSFEALFPGVRLSVDSAQRSAVLESIRFYGESLAQRNLLFDSELTAVKYALQAATDPDDVQARVASQELVAALRGADAFYREHLWPAHDAQNREFVEQRISTIRAIEERVVGDCSKAYQYEFDHRRYRIDLTDYATFFGAYTTNEPYVSATISSRNAMHAGTQGIEVVFHEVSHAMMDRLIGTQAALATELGKPLDHNVWHTILFVTTGNFVREALAERGIEHEIYIEEQALGSRVPGLRGIIDEIAAQWTPYLRGQTTMEQALREILVRIPAPARQPSPSPARDAPPPVKPGG